MLNGKLMHALPQASGGFVCTLQLFVFVEGRRTVVVVFVAKEWGQKSTSPQENPVKHSA